MGLIPADHQEAEMRRYRVSLHAVISFKPSWRPSNPDVHEALAQEELHVYLQQGLQQGGYFGEIAVVPILLEPCDEDTGAQWLRQELTRQESDVLQR